MESSHVRIGRPYGGLCIFYNSNYHNRVSEVKISNVHCNTVLINLEGEKVLLVNVYFPCNTPDNDELITECVASVAAAWNTVECNSIIVVGDFNLDPKVSKFNDLLHMCSMEKLRVVDVEKLPSDTHTYISNQSGHSSWLDHCLVSENLFNESSVSVLEEYLTSDHLMLSISVTLKNSCYVPPDQSDENYEPRLRWNKLTHG